MSIGPSWRGLVQGRENGKALLCVITLEAECFFDVVVVHDDIAYTVHQAVLITSEAHPQFVAQTVGGLINPVHVKNPQDIPVPDAGGFVPEPMLDQAERFGHDVVGGQKTDVFIQKAGPQGFSALMVRIGAVHEGIKCRSINIYGFGLHLRHLQRTEYVSGNLKQVMPD